MLCDTWEHGAAFRIYLPNRAALGRDMVSQFQNVCSSYPPITWGTRRRNEAKNCTGRTSAGIAGGGTALALGSDGSAAVVWAVIDGSQPANQQGSVLAANWPPGGPWGAPETLASGQRLAIIWSEGLVIGQGGRPVSALWLGVPDVDPATTPSCAIFYSRWPEWRIFLPVVLRNAP